MRFLFLTIITLAWSGSAFAALDLDQLTYKSGKEASLTANFRFDALSVLEKGYGISIDAPIGRGWTLGPSLFHYPQSYSFLNFSATGVGLTLLKFFNGKAYHSGWYGGPLVYFVQGDSNTSQLGASPTGFEFGERGGYQWMWGHLDLQAGAELLYLPTVTSQVDFMADLNIGYAL